MFLAAIDQTLLATATPRIASEMGNLSDTSWITVAYLLVATIAAPLYGRLGDRHGRRALLLTAVAVFAVGSLACSMASSMWLLIGARALQGLGGGGLMVLSQALIGELVSPIDRPRYQAYFAMIFAAASVGGPLIGGLVVHHASWRWLFLANLPLCVLAAWRVSRLPVPARSPLRDRPNDPWGVLLFIITAVAALLWLSLVGHRFPWLSTTSALLLAVAMISGTLLMRQQRSHVWPILPLDLLRLPGMGFICATVVCFSASMFALLFLLPIQLQLASASTTAAGAGWQLLPLTVGLVLGSTINGRITARTLMPGRTPPYGMTAAALGILSLAVLPLGPWTGGVAGAVIGLGFGTVMPSAQLTTQVLAGKARLGAASALISLTRSVGASVGTAAFGGLVFSLLHMQPGAADGDVLRVEHLAPEQLSHAFQIVYGVLAACVALGAWGATRVPRVQLTDWDDETPTSEA